MGWGCGFYDKIEIKRGEMKDYFEKLAQNPYEDLWWNVPEKQLGTVNVVGGNAQSFQTVVRTAERLAKDFPLQMVNVVLPESLEGKVPKLPNFEFLPTTDSGAFSGEGLAEKLQGADANLMIGDMSKNAITAKGVTKALEEAEKPCLVTRDAVDLVAEQPLEKMLMTGKVDFLATAKQVQKILRAVYYPKVMTLSQPLMQVVEILHKFTLSYQTGIVTFYSGQILVANDGLVRAVALENSKFSPITLWSGELAAKITALNLYNPGKFIEATIAAVL